MKAKVTIISEDTKLLSLLVLHLQEFALGKSMEFEVGQVSNTPAFNDEQAVDVTITGETNG